jgi:thiol:disulfide interchange protein
MDKTDLSLLLSAFSALTFFLGAAAALVVAPCVAGFLMGQRRLKPP